MMFLPVLFPGSYSRADETGAGQKVIALLGIEWIDTSGQQDIGGVLTTEARRHVMLIEQTISDELEKTGSYEVIEADDSNKAQQIIQAGRDKNYYLHDCNGCQIELGRQLEVDWVLVGWTQKVSNLILNLNLVVYDVKTSERIANAFVDLRGDTDESWLRATHYAIHNILLDKLSDER